MSSTTKTRPEESPQALAIQTASERLPAKIGRLGKEWLAKIRSLDTVEDTHGIRGVVVHNEKQHAAALEAGQLGKGFKKAVEAATQPSEAEMRRRAVRKELLDTEKRVSKLVGSASLVFRDAEAKRLEEEARAEAEKEHKALLKQQEADAKKLERSAKRTKDPEKKQQLEELAQETREEPVQSVEAAVGEVLQEQQQSWRGAGKGSVRENWSANITDEALIPRKYLITQVNMVALNALARDRKSEDLGVPGVRGVVDRGLART